MSATPLKPYFQARSPIFDHIIRRPFNGRNLIFYDHCVYDSILFSLGSRLGFLENVHQFGIDAFGLVSDLCLRRLVPPQKLTTALRQRHESVTCCKHRSIAQRRNVFARLRVLDTAEFAVVDLVIPLVEHLPDTGLKLVELFDLMLAPRPGSALGGGGLVLLDEPVDGPYRHTELPGDVSERDSIDPFLVHLTSQVIPLLPVVLVEIDLLNLARGSAPGTWLRSPGSRDATPAPG